MARLPRLWQFWLPLSLQLAIILIAPARSMYTATTGQSVLLETAPVDPYDLLRGYYVTLNYQISQAEALQDLPGWADVSKAAGGRSRPLSVYVVLEAPDPETQTGSIQAGGADAPAASQPWTPVQVSRDRPQLGDDQVALKGQYRWNRLAYGLERYYIPEDQRLEINERIAQLQRGQRQNYLVEVKVDSSGQSMPVSLWIGDENYRF